MGRLRPERDGRSALFPRDGVPEMGGVTRVGMEVEQEAG